MQSNVAVSGDKVTGALKYVTGYTGFSGAVAEQSGNYLALHFSSTNANASIKVRLYGGNHPDRVVTLDEDGILISRIESTDEVLEVTAYVEGSEPTIRAYDLSGLTLATA